MKGDLMAEIVEIALYRGIGGFFVVFVLLPAGGMFVAYLIYIAVMTVRELRKK